jgi:hypothetical protein
MGMDCVILLTLCFQRYSSTQTYMIRLYSIFQLNRIQFNSIACLFCPYEYILVLKFIEELANISLFKARKQRIFTQTIEKMQVIHANL